MSKQSKNIKNNKFKANKLLKKKHGWIIITNKFFVWQNNIGGSCLVYAYFLVGF